jgi:hypothetical protein
MPGITRRLARKQLKERNSKLQINQHFELKIFKPDFYGAAEEPSQE